MRKGKIMELEKNKKTIFKGELGWGTKGLAFTDMKKTNSDFDDLEYIFNSDGVGFLTDADFDINEMNVTNCYNLV
jgi:hypothetical protein